MKEPLLRIDAPKRFGAREIIVMSLFTSAATISFLSILGAVLFLHSWTLQTGNPVYLPDLSHIMAPIGFMAIYFAVLPFLLANPYIRYLLRKEFAAKTASTPCYDCHITLTPRLYTGFRGVIEDADDIGRLEISRDALVFTGDHINIYLPFDSIVSATSENCGSRRLWMLGNQIVIRTDKLVGLTGFHLNERQSNTTAGSHRIAKEIFRVLQQRINSN